MHRQPCMPRLTLLIIDKCHHPNPRQCQCMHRKVMANLPTATTQTAPMPPPYRQRYKQSDHTNGFRSTSHCDTNPSADSHSPMLWQGKQWRNHRLTAQVCDIKLKKKKKTDWPIHLIQRFWVLLWERFGQMMIDPIVDEHRHDPSPNGGQHPPPIIR